MNKIKLLYVENLIFCKNKTNQQKLTFFFQLENIGYDKHLVINWSGEDKVWHTLSAQYHSQLGNNQEYWSASVTLSLTDEQSLPGNIEFNACYQVLEKEYWLNHHGNNFFSEADSGIKLTNQQALQNVAFENKLDTHSQTVFITTAIDQSFNAEKVTIHWTVDNWKTTSKTLCRFKRDYWHKTKGSHARNPNQFACQIWSAKIQHTELHKLQYVISCDNTQQTLWDNNCGHNYRFQTEQLKVLILNLHCYQEDNQDEKFTTIARAIDEENIDIVCFQEVAEYWRDGQGDWESNSAKLINDRLKNAFHLYTDWSHLGFDKYREGVAILSRYPLSHQESKYVSNSHDIYDINSRKVVSAQVSVPYIGLIHVFSAHLSWLEGGFHDQFNCLSAWAKNNKTPESKATLLCGDFNITAGSKGYEQVIDSDEYEDQYLAVNKQGVFNKIFKVHDDHWQDLLADDYRIDYIFMNKQSHLKAVAASVIFTEQDYGSVSDHCGYLMTFEPQI